MQRFRAMVSSSAIILMEPSIVFLILLVAAAAVVQFTASHALPSADCAPATHLNGSLDFRGDRWPLRLFTGRAGDSVAAAIDIPELMMVRRPLPARCRHDSLVVELPFGFGEVALAQAPGGGWLGSRLLGGDTLRLTFSTGAPPPYAVEEVRVRGGAGDLVADLYLPAGGQGSPGIVMVHGSGQVGRHSLYYRSWADFYARLGIATLIYDKRGVGDSGGDFRTDSAFEGLTADALAAVAYVRSRPEIDSRRVGIGGHSQAGWIAFRAAARDSGVAFLALMAVPAVSVADQEFQRIRAGMRAEGRPDAAINAAIAHMQLLFGVAVTGLGWDGLAASSARVSKEPWVEWVHRPASQENLRWWRTHAPVDPAVDVERLRIPVFAAFSARDPVVPAAYNAGVLRGLLDSTVAPATIVTVPRGDHILEISGRDEAGRWRLPRIHPQVMRELRAWIALMRAAAPRTHSSSRPPTSGSRFDRPTADASSTPPAP